MNLTEKLDFLMSEKNMNKRNLSMETGIPYTTIDGFYKKGTENIKLSTLKKIADYFNITLDEIADDNIDITCKTEDYYINDSSTNYTELLKSNPEMKLLFDAAKDVSEEDLKIVVEMVKRMRK